MEPGCVFRSVELSFSHSLDWTTVGLLSLAPCADDRPLQLTAKLLSPARQLCCSRWASRLLSLGRLRLSQSSHTHKLICTVQGQEKFSRHWVCSLCVGIFNEELEICNGRGLVLCCFCFSVQREPVLWEMSLMSRSCGVDRQIAGATHLGLR